MYSFQLVMNAKTEVATRPGRDERQQDPDERAEAGEPSTIAASSSSFGMPMMKPRSVQTENGSANVM